MSALREPLILSVSGRDRPGILAELAAALDGAGIDIVDIEQATLQNFLALSFLLDLQGDPQRSRHLLRDVIARAAALGLAVDVRHLEPEAVRPLSETDHLVVTLVSERPTAQVVARIAAVTARHGANIISIRRLAEEDLRAGEYVLDLSRVSDVATLRGEIMIAAEDLGVDVGLAREDVYRKSKRVVIFDMDSTLVAEEGIDLLAERAGKAEEVSRLTRNAMEGRLDYATSLRDRVALLAGLPESVLLEVARSLSLSPGAEETVAVLKQLGFRLGVVSGGFEQFVEPIRLRLGIDHAFCNRLEVVDGKLTGGLVGSILDASGKASRVREIAAAEGVPLDQVVGVGDGANDIPMLQIVGQGIAFRAKEATRRSADASIQRNDFRGLLYLLGVSGRDLKRLERSGAGKES